MIVRCIHSIRSKNLVLAQKSLKNLIESEDSEQMSVSVCDMLESIGAEAVQFGLDSVVVQAYTALFGRVLEPKKKVQLLEHLIQLTIPSDQHKRESTVDAAASYELVNSRIFPLCWHTPLALLCV